MTYFHLKSMYFSWYIITKTYLTVSDQMRISNFQTCRITTLTVLSFWDQTHSFAHDLWYFTVAQLLYLFLSLPTKLTLKLSIKLRTKFRYYCHCFTFNNYGKPYKENVWELKISCSVDSFLFVWNLILSFVITK